MADVFLTAMMSFLTWARGLVLGLMFWTFSLGLALAHSGLQRAEPPVESRLKRPPSELKLYFSEPVEKDYSTVRVKDARDAQVDRQDARVDPSNPVLLRVTLQPLERGIYTVIWRVLSVDSHVTEGRFTFQVE